jgi:hypothetical protein
MQLDELTAAILLSEQALVVRRCIGWAEILTVIPPS